MSRRAARAETDPDASGSGFQSLKYKRVHHGWTLMLVEHPLFPYLLWKPKQTWSMSINILRHTQRHKTTASERVEPSHPQPRFPYEVAMVMIIILDQQDTVIIAIKIS